MVARGDGLPGRGQLLESLTAISATVVALTRNSPAALSTDRATTLRSGGYSKDKRHRSGQQALCQNIVKSRQLFWCGYPTQHCPSFTLVHSQDEFYGVGASFSTLRRKSGEQALLSQQPFLDPLTETTRSALAFASGSGATTLV